MQSNYMKAAELKIAKLDPISDLEEIIWLRFNAKINDIMLKVMLEVQDEL